MELTPDTLKRLPRELQFELLAKEMSWQVIKFTWSGNASTCPVCGGTITDGGIYPSHKEDCAAVLTSDLLNSV